MRNKGINENGNGGSKVLNKRHKKDKQCIKNGRMKGGNKRI
jgi:hypothetical protein